MLHNRGDTAAVGDDASIFFDFGECIEYTRFHLHTAFSLGWNVGIVIPRKPCLVFGSIFQLFEALHLENAKIHFPEPGINFLGYIAKQNTQGFIRPLHATGKETDIFDFIMNTL